MLFVFKTYSNCYIGSFPVFIIQDLKKKDIQLYELFIFYVCAYSSILRNKFGVLT